MYEPMRLNLWRAAKRRLLQRKRLPTYVPKLPAGPWSAEFKIDALQCSRRYRQLNVADDFNREALHIEDGTSINSVRLVRLVDRLHKNGALPRTLRSDNGLISWEQRSSSKPGTQT